MRLRPNTRAATRRAAGALALALLALASLTLVVYAATGARAHRRAKPKLALAGALSRPLRPGSSQALDVTVSNRFAFRVSVARLKVTLAVRPRRRGASCSVRRDFSLRQLDRRAYPIVLPPRSRRRLSRLRVRRGLLPRLTMRDLPRTNQDACQHASLRLRYSVQVRRSRARR